MRKWEKAYETSVKPRMLYTLYVLALEGALHDVVQVKLSSLAPKLHSSKQTASRWLKELEREGLVVREARKNGLYLKITGKGEKLLLDMYSNLKRLFEELEEFIEVRGTVFTGLGEGAYYVGLDGYMKQFKEKLGFKPYLGTLNLRVRGEDLNKLKRLSIAPYIEVKGFKNERRTYGSVKCYRALINDRVWGALVKIERSHYGEDVIELIAPVNLRETLGLRDGDEVNVKILVKALKGPLSTPREGG